MIINLEDIENLRVINNHKPALGYAIKAHGQKIELWVNAGRTSIWPSWYGDYKLNFTYKEFKAYLLLRGIDD